MTKEYPVRSTKNFPNQADRASHEGFASHCNRYHRAGGGGGRKKDQRREKELKKKVLDQRKREDR